MTPQREPVTADDLLLAAQICHDALMPAIDRDWSVPAGDLAWSCQTTLDHLPNALLSYANHLATRATERRVPVRNGDPDRSPAELLSVTAATAAILAAVTHAAPAGTRAFHPAGMADPEGFLAMGCEEIMIHTDDIARGMGLAFRPPEALARRVLRRLFPWAPTDADPWAAVRWASGRAALGDRERLDADWYWQCAPLSEWDGTIKRRTAPPAWT
ncbi:MAG: hypothetical protein H0T75_22365 [Rhizobiales bacterium]|nr:hypothetical protein [Hyphomicrobiales bacterium]